MSKKIISIIFYILSIIILFMGILISWNEAASEWCSFLRFPDLDYLFEFLFVFFPAFIPYLIGATITFFVGYSNDKSDKNK